MGKIANLDLVGSIRLQATNEIIKCIVRSLNEDNTKALIFTNDERIYHEGSIELMIFSPLDNSPIRCIGRIAYESIEDEGIVMEGSGYLVNIYITHIGRMEQRRLGVLIAQKRAFFSSGR